jgi:hypothetical protein
VTRSVSNSTPGKYLSLADILFSSSFSVLKRRGGGEKEKEKKKERTAFTAPNPPPIRVCQSSSNPKFVCQSSSDLDAYVRD